MNFRFGEWYVSSDVENTQISNYEVVALPLSYLYIMMIAVDKNRLVPASIEVELVINVMENFIEEKSIVNAPIHNTDIESARKELENVIDSFHKSILKYDSILIKKENEIDEKS